MAADQTPSQYELDLLSGQLLGARKEKEIFIIFVVSFYQDHLYNARDDAFTVTKKQAICFLFSGEMLFLFITLSYFQMTITVTMTTKVL